VKAELPVELKKGDCKTATRISYTLAQPWEVRPALLTNLNFPLFGGLAQSNLTPGEPFFNTTGDWLTVLPQSHASF